MTENHGLGFDVPFALAAGWNKDADKNRNHRHASGPPPAAFSFSDADYVFLTRLSKETIKKQK